MADILDQMTGSADYLSGADTTPHRIVPSFDGTHRQFQTRISLLVI